jgi:hypothetical protein
MAPMAADPALSRGAVRSGASVNRQAINCRWASTYATSGPTGVGAIVKRNVSSLYRSIVTTWPV